MSPNTKGGKMYDDTYPHDFPTKNKRRAIRLAQLKRLRKRAQMIAKYIWRREKTHEKDSAA